MAEETTHISLSPEIKKIDKVNPRRNSTGIVKRSFTGNSSSKNYLRASAGSCHDFCKYGREHSFQVKARNPKTIRKTPSSDQQKNTESEVLAPKLKTSAVKLKPSNVHSSKQNLGTVVLDEKKKKSKVKLKPSYDVLHSPEPPEVIKREIIPSKQLQVSYKQNSSNTKSMKANEIKTMSSSKWSPSLKSRPLLKNPSSSSTASVGFNGTRRTSIKPGKITAASKTTVKKLSATPSSSPSPKTSGGRAVNLYTTKQSSLKLVSPLKDQKRIQISKLKKPDENKVDERTLHVVEADTDDNDKVMESVQGDCIVQISSSQSLQSLNSLSFPGSQFTSSQEDVIEESEYIDKDLQKSQHTDGEDLDEFEYAPEGDLEESEYTESEADEFISEDDESVNINEVDTLRSNQNQSLKEGRVVHSADKDGALTRSKFRKGRIVDLQSTNNVPRRLKFRWGRVAGSNGYESVARRRNFEKREVGDDPNGASPSPKKVVLRHQGMQGKKDAQGLYNNVIEETASKLVESRKSKVKALVGAFETVISLQES